MAEYVGRAQGLSALELGAIAARAALARTGVEPGQVDHVVFGNVLQTSADAIYGARHVGLKAGLPVEVPALTVNRLCGSGIQAAISGAQLIQLGEAEIVLTGGMESMSQAPHVIRGLRSGLRLGQGAARRLAVGGAHRHALRLQHGRHRRELRREVRRSRAQAQDEYALRSQQLAAAAWEAGRLAEEVVPVEVKTRKGTERLRAATITCGPTPRSRGSPSCARRSRKNGCVTAGNASGIVDGGAALVLASRAAVERLGVTPLAQAARLGHDRRRADADGHGAGAGDAEAAREDGADARRHRPVRDQRGVRGAVPGGGAGAWAAIATRSTSTAAPSRSAIRSA